MELRMGDLYSDGSTLLLIADSNEDKEDNFKVIVTANNATYYFEDHDSDKRVELDYKEDIKNGEYKYVGSINEIWKKVRDE